MKWARKTRSSWNQMREARAVRGYLKQFGRELLMLTHEDSRDLTWLAQVNLQHAMGPSILTAEEILTRTGDDVGDFLEKRRARYRVLLRKHQARQRMLEKAIKLARKYGMQVLVTVFLV